ncbi:MAG: metal-dependent hydrolase, partial [Pseudomonadota bacterium]
MGLTPGYAFRFAIGELDDNGIRPIAPERDNGLGRIASDDWDWFMARLKGLPSVRNAEANAGGVAASSQARACGAGSATG